MSVEKTLHRIIEYIDYLLPPALTRPLPYADYVLWNWFFVRDTTILYILTPQGVSFVFAHLLSSWRCQADRQTDSQKKG